MAIYTVEDLCNQALREIGYPTPKNMRKLLLGALCLAPLMAVLLPGLAAAQGVAPVAGGQNFNITPTDCSGTIATGGTAQNAFGAQVALHGFTIANIDTTAGSGEPLWISFTTAAAASTAGSYPLAAPIATTFAFLSSFTAPPGFGSNHAVSVIAVTTGHKYSCTYW